MEVPVRSVGQGRAGRRLRIGALQRPRPRLGSTPARGSRRRSSRPARSRRPRRRHPTRSPQRRCLPTTRRLAARWNPEWSAGWHGVGRAAPGHEDVRATIQVVRHVVAVRADQDYQAPLGVRAENRDGAVVAGLQRRPDRVAQQSRGASDPLVDERCRPSLSPSTCPATALEALLQYATSPPAASMAGKTASPLPATTGAPALRPTPAHHPGVAVEQEDVRPRAALTSRLTRLVA